MRKPIILATAAVVSVVFSVFAGTVFAAGDAAHPKEESWPQSGPFGTFDRAALQRGFQIYREVCSGCHSLRLVAFRNLRDIGFSEEQVKAIAAEWDYHVPTIDKDGEPTERAPLPTDKFVPPFANAAAAKAANNGALPPDLSLVVKSRRGHENYVFSLLTGFEDPPEGFELGDGLNYNPYFPGHQIAMAPPLSDDAVEYTDGTEASLDQLAHDVTSFLAWAAEPKLEERKRVGFKVVVFLVLFTGLLYVVKRKVWKALH